MALGSTNGLSPAHLTVPGAPILAPAPRRRSSAIFSDPGLAATALHSTQATSGRESELAHVEDFLARAGSGGAALLVHGDAGVGKSHLLAVAARLAAERGARVLRQSGSQYRTPTGYGALEDLVRPLRHGIGRLPQDLHQALRAAVDGVAETPPDRLLLFNAVLALLRDQSRDKPLLLVVDDLPWHDPAMAAVLGFVARRTAGARLGVIAASRTWASDSFRRAGIPQLHLRPLSAAAGEDLVARAHPGLPTAVRRRIVAEARGNPLALLELPHALAATSTAADGSQPDVLAVAGRSIPTSSRLIALPPATRRVLALIALEGTGDLTALQRAAPGQPVLDLLAPAETARVVHVDMATRRAVFHNPLVREAAVDMCPPEELRRINRTLAALFAHDPERRAHFAAQAATEPDDNVADLLVAAAERHLARGDATGAVTALTRAAGLFTRRQDQSRLLARAAYTAAWIAGDLSSAARLLARARAQDPDADRCPHAAAAAAWIRLNQSGRADVELRLLTEALAAAARPGPQGDTARDDAEGILLLLTQDTGLRPRKGRLLGAPRPAGNTLTPSGSLLDAAALNVRDEVDILLDRQDSPPHHRVGVSAGAAGLDLLDGFRPRTWRAVDSGRHGLACGGLAALADLSLTDLATGRWTEAQALADEGIATAEALGHTFTPWRFLLHKALLAAVRGDPASAQWADRAEAITRAHNAAAATQTLHHPRALAALTRGDFEAAYKHARRLTAPGRLCLLAPHALWSALDLVEAARGSDRPDEAAAHARALRTMKAADVSARLHMLSYAARALAAHGQEATDLFTQALCAPGKDRWPFEYARVQLLYGEHLRRTRNLPEARVHLVTAVGTFQRLGTQPWADRATEELRAAGRPSSTPSRDTAAELTGQERRIALLAAQGLTNRQIGERLFLSPRTVGGHLRNVFPKLGITTRAALRDALSRSPAD